MTEQLPDIRLNRDNVKGCAIIDVFPRCCRISKNTDVQSVADNHRCINTAMVKIQLKTGQIYDLCDFHAHELGVL
jgi:hypothetical protein